MITKEQAMAALDSLDNCARMDIGVDAYGPRLTLEKYIEQMESILAGERARCAALCRQFADEHSTFVSRGMPTHGDDPCTYVSCDVVATAYDLANLIEGKTQ